MKGLARVILAAALVLFGTSAWPFADGFEAHALEPSDIKAISIDAAPAIPVQNVKVDAAGLLTAVKVGPPVPPVLPPNPASALPPGFSYLKGKIWSWGEVFYGAQEWCGPSYLAPVGSRTAALPKPYVSGDAIAGKVITVKFTAPPVNVDIGTNGSQSIAAANYNAMPANYWTITVTRRPGDVSLAAGTCGQRSANPGVRIGPNVTGPCKFVPGETLYLNTAAMNLDDPLNPRLNSCQHDNASDGKKCDRNFKIRAFLPPASGNYCTTGEL